jgi:hypothetical protein
MVDLMTSFSCAGKRTWQSGFCFCSLWLLHFFWGGNSRCQRCQLLISFSLWGTLFSDRLIFHLPFLLPHFLPKKIERNVAHWHPQHTAIYAPDTPPFVPVCLVWPRRAATQVWKESVISFFCYLISLCSFSRLLTPLAFTPIEYYGLVLLYATEMFLITTRCRRHVPSRAQTVFSFQLVAMVSKNFRGMLAEIISILKFQSQKAT